MQHYEEMQIYSQVTRKKIQHNILKVNNQYTTHKIKYSIIVKSIYTTYLQPSKPSKTFKIEIYVFFFY